MAVFSYRARDDKGSLITGNMDADNIKAVYMQLDSLGLYPVSVSEVKGIGGTSGATSIKSLLGGYQKITYDDLIFFTRQLQTIIKAGIPLISGLKALEEQTTKERLKNIIRDIYMDIDKGKSFSEAMARHSDVFPEVYISMIRAGEIGGVLEDVLERLIGMLEFQMKTKEMIKSALRYPVMVIVSLMVAFFVLVTFVIPKFVPLFKSAKIDLPLPTRIMILINDIVQQYGVYLIAGVIILIVGFVFYKRTENGRLQWDRFKLRLPLLGDILHKIYMSRFANMFENMIRAGVPVIKALEIVSKTIGNAYIAGKIDEVGMKIEKGKGISRPLKETGIFPPLVIHLVSTGESTGSLEEMLNEVSNHYDREITYSVGRLSAWVEPILTAGLSIMVLFMALAIFMPWWNMMSAMKGGG
ncbi:MAG TPA: type II secretion system F family protein [Syntrophorhabdaceae bacterium]|nr:type II secretion system F family protein [Syntrophorhabdaceae bacterium]HOL06412.1 type II secretion system F family protein [Syntrophorhabdaceae bacterium]HOT42423.1 type II secretion system F family protein [Syntrophorhabdaceae bacterium]HQE80420.1 type II secretion system F family protein [Syntrophorhabdaceae bacterium]HQH43639.1 type II secretion system F family protein [Syntrophorhabdaceae bacterium]